MNLMNILLVQVKKSKNKAEDCQRYNDSVAQVKTKSIDEFIVHVNRILRQLNGDLFLLCYISKID